MTELAVDLRVATVGIAGGGRLRAAVEAALAPRHRVVTLDEASDAAVAGCALVLAVSDGWQTDHAALRAACRAAGVPWLPLRVELGQAVLGPVVRPGTPGCPSCAESRRCGARSDGRHRTALLARHGDRLAGAAAPRLTGFLVEAVAAVAAEEVAALTAESTVATAPLTAGAVVCVALDTLAASRHLFLPNPRCAECGGVPNDAPATAALTLEPRQKPAPDAYRIRSLDDLSAALHATYVDAEAGLVASVRPLEAYGIAVAEAPMTLPDTGLTEHGFGRTLDHRAAGLCAVLEALERYGGYVPGRTRPTVWAAYADVRDRALDPRSVGLYEPERHRLPDFPYQEFTEETPLQWVWAHSFARGEPILVPSTFAYYGHSLGWMRGRPLTYETSNGCALGGCLEEAILHGILEVAERDAFLMTWYARLPVRRIDLASARDRRIPLLAERVARASGYEIMAFAITLEHGVPAVWAMAVHPDDEPGRAKALCAAGASLDPEGACAGALAELVPMLATRGEYGQQVDRVRSMVDDPDQVRAMADHSLLYCHPAAFDRLDFLTSDRPRHAFAEAFPQPRIRHDDLRDDLTELVDRYKASGLDVIVVDQTTPEHRAGGLRCVKVIIPGTLPMTFGHRARRTYGLPRLLHVPHLLGYRDRPLDPSDVNPHPHPFP